MKKSVMNFFRFHRCLPAWVTPAISLLLLISGCVEDEERTATEIHRPDLPEHIDTLSNLRVFSVEDQEYDTVRLVKEQVYESNEEVLMPGYINELAVDSNDRVYIKSSIPGSLGIFVFGPEGEHIATIGRHGRGPGEFQVIAEIAVRGDRLYAYDSHQYKLAVFSLSDFSLRREEIFSKSTVVNVDSTLVRLTTGEFYPMADGSLRMRFETDWNSNENSKYLLYNITDRGEVITEPILSQRRYILHSLEMDRLDDGFPLIPFTTPFSRHSLLSSSTDDSMFAAWTEDFLIKVYDAQGNYARAIYYPYNNRVLEFKNVEMSEGRRNYLVENNQIPDTWPVLHHILVDDEDRIWAFTITDSDSSFQCWVMDKQGNLLARFAYPEDRSSRFVRSTPLLEVKNGYLYKNERDIRAGIDRIIKYRIEFLSRTDTSHE